MNNDDIRKESTEVEEKFREVARLTWPLFKSWYHIILLLARANKILYKYIIWHKKHRLILAPLPNVMEVSILLKL